MDVETTIAHLTKFMPYLMKIDWVYGLDPDGDGAPAAAGRILRLQGGSNLASGSETARYVFGMLCTPKPSTFGTEKCYHRQPGISIRSADR